MYPYFVRVYTMLDGTKREIAARYPSYECAEADLNLFGTKGCLYCGEGASGMSLVMYASIEKRFAPQPLDDAPPLELAE